MFWTKGRIQFRRLVSEIKEVIFTNHETLEIIWIIQTYSSHHKMEEYRFFFTIYS